MRGKRVGQGCRIYSTKIYTPYYHDRVTVFNEDRLIMYSSLLYSFSSTGVHKTEEPVRGLILRIEANVLRVTLYDHVIY